MIDGIPNRPLYFYQKDIIDEVIVVGHGKSHGCVLKWKIQKVHGMGFNAKMN